MMTSKEKILEYLKRKHKLINNITGLNYCYDSDFDDVEKWEDRICDQIWSEMLAYAKNQKLVLNRGGLSAKLCPWCLFKHFMLIDCAKCGWGRAHGGGNCMSYDYENSWHKIRMALKEKEHDYNDFPITIIKEIENENKSKT